MKVVVIGGHSRSVGKTSVVAGLIAALPERNWTALKVTQYGHSVCSHTGHDCDCAVTGQLHSYAVTEEQDRSGDSDTSRFLVAGATRSLWVRTRQGFLAEAMPDIRREMSRSENVIVESNSILNFIRPDLYLTVLDYATPDFKQSALRFLDRADGIILHHAPQWSRDLAPSWDGVSPKLLEGKTVFWIQPPQYVTEEVVDFVRNRLC